MRHLGLLVLGLVVAAPIACEVYTAPPPGYGYRAQVQVQAPPPPEATVQVGVDPNAQQPDPNAQVAADPNAAAPDEQASDSDDADASAVDDFRAALQPYGTWMDDPQYGTIWMPSPATVGGDFTPYLTGGHWNYDKDYTWVSDYDWGWGPFHYGRWFQYPGRGWAWIPGKEYAGAWVTWRNGDDGYGYVGWAPTPPSYYYRGGQVMTLATPWFEPVYDYAPTGDLFSPTIRTRIIRDPVRLREIVGRTRPYAVRGGFVTGAGGTRMRVRGPAPNRLGIADSRVVRLPANARSVVRAQEFSRTHPPPAHVVHTVTPTHPPIGGTHTVETRPNVHQTVETHPSVHQPETRPNVHQTVETHPGVNPAVHPSNMHTVPPAVTTSQSNVRRPYPGPGTTHTRSR